MIVRLALANDSVTVTRVVTSEISGNFPRKISGNLFQSFRKFPKFLNNFFHFIIFTALHEMQRGLTMRFLSVCLSVCPSVCPSVRLSNACIVTKRKKNLSRFLYHSFCLVLWEEEWLAGGDTFYLKFWVNRPALERNCRFWTNNRS